MNKIFAVLIAVMLAAGYAVAQDQDVSEKLENVADSAVEEVGSTAKTAVTDTANTAEQSTTDVTVAATEAVTAPVTAVTDAVKAPAKKEFNVFTEKYDLKNHYIPSGWMGDYGDIGIDDGCITTPNNGKTCFKIKYSAQGSQGAGWMGIYWQNPANNWGTQMGGYDLTGYNKLTFYARGDKGGEIIAEFKIGGINGNYSDSDSTSMGPITLTKDWKQYIIDLKGMDLSYISGGFELSASSKDNPEGFVIYLDDIKYEE